MKIRWWLLAAVGVEVAYRAITRRKCRMYERAMADVADALDAAGVEYWLDWGTLLGAVRDGRLIPHDTDVDFTALRSQVPLVRQVDCPGYVVQQRDTDLAVRVPVHPTLDTVRDMGLVHCELADEVDGFVTRPYSPVRIPVSLVRPLGRVTLAGRTYPVPGRASDYLDALYGYSGRTCIAMGGDRYRPCRSWRDYAAWTWNTVIFYRVYFLWKGTPLPRRWKQAVERHSVGLYARFASAPKT